MFKIELFVDDKKLAPLLRTLASLGTSEPKVAPVVGAEMKRGKVKSNGHAHNTPAEQAVLSVFKGQELTTQEVMKAMKGKGVSPNSASTYLSSLVASGQIQRLAPGRYTKR